jgi:hypothetical protein
MAVDPSVRIDIAAEFTGKKAFDKADKSTSKLTKNVKSLAGAFGLAFSTRAIVNFSKESVKAFAADDAAITILRQNLKNLGLAYQVQNAENFIGNLERQSGILDDELRPAYSSLSKVTLSTTKTQELMALAVDLARANGLEFTSVIKTLSRAYVGNYKGLKQLNTGLTDAQLASKSFAEVQAILIQQSKGSGQAYIETFAGSIDKLTVASANAKEIIGEGLVDLFADMAGNGDIEKATDNVITLATAVSDFLKDVDKYNLLDYIGVALTGSITEETFRKLDKKPTARRFFTGGSGKSTEFLTAQKEAAAAAAKLKADKKAAAVKAALEKKAAADKLKLAKAASKFDLEKIGIAAALRGKISKEEQIRLLLLQAIADEDAKKADELTKKLEEIQKKNVEIAETLAGISKTDNPFAAWTESLITAVNTLRELPPVIDAAGNATARGKNKIKDEPILSEYDGTNAAALAAAAQAAADLAAQAAARAASEVLASQTITNAIIAAAAAGGFMSGGSSSMFNPYATTPGSSAGYGTQGNTIYPPIEITIMGNVMDGDDFTEKVNQAFINAQRKGYSQLPAGALP